MKCISEVRGQTRLDNGRICWFKKGEVAEFKKCPTNFRPLNKKKVNFKTASEEELMEVKWTFDDAAEAIKEAYRVDLVNEPGTKKSEIVKQILDARFRQV